MTSEYKRIGIIVLGHDDYNTGKDEISIKNIDKCIAFLKDKDFEVVKYDKVIKSREEALKASLDFIAKDLSGLIVYASSFGVANPALVVLQELKHIPCCLYGISGNTNDTMTASAQLILLIKGIIQKMDYSYKLVIGNAFGINNYNDVAIFANSCSTLKKLSRSRIGIIGNGYSFDMLAEGLDILKTRKMFGTEFIHFDTYDLIKVSKEFNDTEYISVLEKLNKVYNSNYKLEDKYIRDICGFYLGLKKIKTDNSLDAINVKCYPELGKSYRCVPCISMSMLTSFDDTTLACEGALSVTLTMLIFKYLSKTNSIYGDIVENLNIEKNSFGLNICGYVPYDLYEKEKGLRISEFNHPEAEGLINSCVLKKGKLVFGRLQEDSQGFNFIYGSGEGINTEPLWGFIPAVNIKIDGSIEKLFENLIGHHIALVWHDVAAEIEEFCRILRIKKILI